VFEKAGSVEIVYNIEENTQASNAPAPGGSAQHRNH
jgi:hypothetical protein